MTLEEEVVPELNKLFNKAGLQITLKALIAWIRYRNQDRFYDGEDIWLEKLESGYNSYLKWKDGG